MRLGTYYRTKLLELLDIKADKENVLDVGCFDGYWLSTQSAKNKYALDVNVDRKYKNINYIETSALNIPFKDDKFDQVFALDVIEHLPNNTEQKFLSELIRITKIGGEIIITTPSKNIKIFPSFLTNWVSKKWGHLKGNGYSKEELIKYLEKTAKIEYHIFENNAPYFLKSYLTLWFLWKINKKFTKKLVKKIIQKDIKSMKGEKGFFIIKIKKIENCQ